MADARSRVYVGNCRRDRLTSKECPFWFVSLFCDYGLPVTVFQWENESYIVLNPERWNIVRLLDVFYNKNIEKVKRFDLNAASPKTIINSMESEYDKSILRGVLAATSTRSELYDLGLKPEAAVKTLKSVLAVSEEVENALIARKDMTVPVLKEKIEHKECEIQNH